MRPGGQRLALRSRTAAFATLACTLVFAFRLCDPAQASPHEVTYVDGVGDATPRLTDPDADNPFDPDAHRLPDLWEMTIGTWAPDDAEADIFMGNYAGGGKFFRLDLVLGGLVNPPGGANALGFEPFRYGDHPVFGFVEIDMDQDVETGGELDAPQYRYLGNVVRFGGKPAVHDLLDRVALDASAFDGNFLTPPYVERHGEEFHLALLGGQFGTGDLEELAGNGDYVFDEGETWRIFAPLFHRAHGYEPFSLADGGGVPGEYAPVCTVEFSHDTDTDATTISLVFPLTNQGAAQMEGEAEEPNNADPTDQASVLEALTDLHDSAVFLDQYPTGLPEEALITEWQNQDPEEHIDPLAWRITVLLGTSYTAFDPSGEYYVWTDVYPGVVRGDVNGDDEADPQDRQLIQQYIEDEDAEDGVVDGRVELAGFATNFSVFDVNHNSTADDLDVSLVSPLGDLDDDVDIDLADVFSFQACFSGKDEPYAPYACGLADLDADGDVDLEDWRQFEDALHGPGVGE